MNEGHTHSFEYTAGKEAVTPTQSSLRVQCSDEGCPIIADQYFIRDSEESHVFQPSELAEFELGEYVAWIMVCLDCGAEKELTYEFERTELSPTSKTVLTGEYETGR